jgi:hypothetical protein
VNPLICYKRKLKNVPEEEPPTEGKWAFFALVGLYFAVHYVMWILLGSAGGWGTWYAWMMGHNLDLWAMFLPIVGVLLLFYRKSRDS